MIAPAVDRPIPGDRVQPGRQRSDRRIEQLGPVPEGEERFLDHLLGDLSIRRQPAGRREDRVDVAVVEITQGRLRASRHLADKWAGDGFLARIKALINIDMIGDAELDILHDGNSSQTLVKLIWDTAEKIGYGKYFTRQASATDDDHMPFVRLGVNAADVIDLDYPVWHTPQDTMDKLSAHSFQVVGEVIVAVLRQLEGVR